VYAYCRVASVVNTAVDVGTAVIKAPIDVGKVVYDAPTDDKGKKN